MSLRPQVLARYRSLLRIERAAFSGDLQAKVAAFQKTRAAFDSNRNETSPEKITKLLEDAKQTGEFIKNCIVQLKETKPNAYEMNLQPQHLNASSGKYGKKYTA